MIAYECLIRFILRYIFFFKSFRRAGSASSSSNNNRKETDEQNRYQNATETCVKRFMEQPKYIDTISYRETHRCFICQKSKRLKTQLVKTSFTMPTKCIEFAKSR